MNRGELAQAQYHFAFARAHRLRRVRSGGIKILVGCERSGIVRDAFRVLGFDAYSCDLAPAEDGSLYHLQMDVREALQEHGPWDLFIVHPDCRRLANSGVLRLYIDGKKTNGRDPAKWLAMEEGAKFFLEMLNAPVPRICVENPVMHGHAKRIIGAEPTQSIQPYEFGDPESKRTCLWLIGLPPLVPTDILSLPECGHWNNQTPSGQNKLGPSPTRHIERARTYPGIAKAMAAQWGSLLRNRT
jgi:hypothetical protein